MTKTTKDLATYEERTHKLESKAHKALLSGIARDWAAVEAAATEAGKQTVIGVNRLRACGEKFKQLCGHDQLTLDFFMRHRDSLPKSMSYTGAKCSVHVSNRIEQDVETPQEALFIQRDLFLAINAYTEPKRTAPQQLHDSNPWSEFISGVSSLTSLLDRLDDRPMSEWPREKLEQFVKTTQPVVEKHAAAVKMIGGAV